MPTALSAPPLRTPLVEPPRPGRAPTWLITSWWNEWFQSLVDRAQTSSYAQASATLTTQNASIGLTSLLPTAAAGLYRVNIRVRVTTVGSVSSSIQVTITTTDGGVTCTNSTTAYTGNLTTAPQSAVFIVKADASTPIQYSTTYASNAAGEMVYELEIVVEAL